MKKNLMWFLLLLLAIQPALLWSAEDKKADAKAAKVAATPVADEIAEIDPLLEEDDEFLEDEDYGDWEDEELTLDEDLLGDETDLASDSVKDSVQEAARPEVV